MMGSDLFDDFEAWWNEYVGINKTGPLGSEETRKETLYGIYLEEIRDIAYDAYMEGWTQRVQEESEEKMEITHVK